MFVGREHELALIKNAIASKRAELIILYGRRRVGKSTLLGNVAPHKNSLIFEALQNTSKKNQVNHFLRQLSEQTQLPLAAGSDWHDAFDALSFHIKKGTRYVVFDEIPWMASGRIELISLLKFFWDNKWKKNKGLTLVLCGSIANFMVKHIVHSKALHNRKTLEIKLAPLLAKESKLFFKNLRSKFEISKFLMTFGGIPKYLEQIDPKKSFADNLDRLCFQKHGFFFNEFETLFKEQFKVMKTYERIICSLSLKNASKEVLAESLNISSGGGLTAYISTLERADFIKTFSTIQSFGKRSKTSKIVLWDEWLRFYFTWVNPYRKLIAMNTKPGLLERISSGAIDSYFGLCFERLCMKNLSAIFDYMNIDFHQVVDFGPFFRQRSRKNTKGEGIQIDLLVQRKGHVLTLFECKYSSRPLNISVIDEVKRKVRFLKAPSKFTVERVLISAGDVTQPLKNSDYFHHIIGLDALFG